MSRFISAYLFRHLERSGAKSKDQLCSYEKGQAELILRQAQDDGLVWQRLLLKSLTARDDRNEI
jgi:hypothetical protein